MQVEKSHKYFNRDGFNVSLKFIKEDEAILETNAPTMRLAGVSAEESSFIYVDPTGGPMIGLGDKVEDKIITKIYSENNKIYIKFNENN